jgi:hypothetical protein
VTRSGRAPHPLAGSTCRNWLRTLARYRSRDLKWGRIARISAVVAAGAPFRWYERLRWGRKIASVTVQDPVFLIGHWQSGHSRAQLLLACDPRFATLRLRHAVVPAASLAMRRILPRLLNRRIPRDRRADRLPLTLDSPQGDDLPLGLVTAVSFYNAWYFPQQADAVFRHSVLMKGLTGRQVADWQRHYVRLLQTVLLSEERRRIVVRSAANTARIPQLLEVFPDARFVYCHRNPYEVFAASLERWCGLTSAWSIERTPLPDSQVEELTLAWYEQLLNSYLRDRALLPAGRLCEVAYADLQQRPLDIMRQVYDTLGLGDFAAARPEMERLLKTHPWQLAGKTPLTPAQREQVARRWRFAFEIWGYPL